MDVQQLPERARRLLKVLLAHCADEGPLSREMMRAESGLSQSAVGRALKDLERCYVRVMYLGEHNRFLGYGYLVSNQVGCVTGSSEQPGEQPAWLREGATVSNQDDHAVSTLARASFLDTSLEERDRYLDDLDLEERPDSLDNARQDVLDPLTSFTDELPWEAKAAAELEAALEHVSEDPEVVIPWNT